MGDPRDHVPGYRMIRVNAPQDAAGAAADDQEARAQQEHPGLSFAGPVFGVVREREEGGWEVVTSLSGLAPQDARDSMGSVFRQRARQAREAGDAATHGECMRAAERMDWEAIDEVTVLGTRYRVVRADRFILTGPDGPQPPCPADETLAGPDQASDGGDPMVRVVIDPVTGTGLAQAVLTVELLASIYPAAKVPAEVHDDAVRAQQSHPGGVLLPAAFTVAERVGGHWRPVDYGTSATPYAARDYLVGYLRVTVPWELDLDPADRDEYAAAAQRLEDQQPNDLRVAGRHFRVVRVERLVRFGPDGPEGPRPSDPDPQPPIMAQQPPSQDTDPDAPIELDDDAKRLLQLFHEEEQRRKARPDNH
jgi:Family of unknown function (DUF5954)